MHVKKALGLISNPRKCLVNWVRWGKVFFLAVAVISPFLIYYNLGINPRSWHDEGASLTFGRTLAEDGVYAMRNSDGYQTFGPVQSIGPTVILPIAACSGYLGSVCCRGGLL